MNRMNKMVLWIGAALVLAAGAAAQEPARKPDPAKMPVAGATMPQRRLPVDENGWTILKPAADSRLIYVSSNAGDDATGKAHTPDDPAVGSDPFRPAGEVKPFKTIATAMKNARKEHPDWVLLKRGDEWQEYPGTLPNGRDKTAPFLMSAYGDRPERPVLDSPPRFPLEGGFHDIAIVGIEFYADAMDPKSPRFDPTPRQPPAWSILIMEGVGRGLLMEDCCLRYTGVGLQTRNDGRLEEVVLRRNLFLDNYSRKGHSNIFASGASILLEENIFDHNGWLVHKGADVKAEDAPATIFNHNTYFSTCYDTVFRGNMFLRASSIGNKWTADGGPGSAHNLTMDNNLYVEGEIGISAGGNQSGPLRFKDVRITNNVFMHIGRDRPTNRNLGWYIEILDWDGGLVSGNLLLHQQSEKVGNVYGINMSSHGKTKEGKPYKGVGEHSRNIKIQDNIIYGLNGCGVMFNKSQNLSNVSFTGNLVQFPDLKSRVLSVNALTTNLSFANNKYFSGENPDAWFNLEKKEVDFKAWTKDSGETGSAEEEVRFLDPTRSVETYNASLGGKPTFEDFIMEVRKQSKTNWRKEYTAAAVNAYVREGFAARPVPVPATLPPAKAAQPATGGK